MGTKRALLIVSAAWFGIFLASAQDQKQDQKKDEKKGPQWQGQDEYKLYESAFKDPNAATRLTTLDKWKSQFPGSEFSDVRLKLYLVTYEQLQRYRDSFDTAKQVLSKEPDFHVAIAVVLARGLPLNQPVDLDFTEQTSRHVIANADRIYAPDKRLETMSEAQWTALKRDIPIFAQKNLAAIAIARKDSGKAEAEIPKALQQDPNASSLNYSLAGILSARSAALSSEDPNKTKIYSQALFHFARAGVHQGPGSADAALRKTSLAHFEKAYSTYRGGDMTEMDKVLAVAKTSALPPDGFYIESNVDIALKKAAQDKAKRDANPMLALWTDIRTALTGSEAAKYWEDNMKGTTMPKLSGKLVSHSPATRPKQLLIAIEKDGLADATLTFETPLAGKMDPGAEISFEGIPESYTVSPFMVVFNVEKEKVQGWAGKAEPAKTNTRKSRKAPTKKK